MTDTTTNVIPLTAKTAAERARLYRERKKKSSRGRKKSVSRAASRVTQELSPELMPVTASRDAAQVVENTSQTINANIPGATPSVTAGNSPEIPVTAPVTERHPEGFWGVVTRTLGVAVAIALAGIAAFFSITGMMVLFPGAPVAIVVMGVVMESAKLVTVAFLAHQWRTLGWLVRIVLAILVVGLAAINAAGVYSQLVAAHVGERGQAEATLETRLGDLDARIEPAAAKVADLDRQVAEIDAAVASATAKGKARTGAAVLDSQRKARGALAGEREQAATTLATLKAERAQVAAQGHRQAAESAPIVYTAMALGLGGDSEQAIRMLIALMVLCCDPLAIALTAAASSRRPA